MIRAAIAVAGALLLTGCSGASIMPSASSTPAQPTRSATPLASAISATSAPGTARIEIRILTDIAGAGDELSGVGLSVFGTGDSDIAWQAAAGTSREVTLDGVAALQLDPPDGEWIAVPDGTWIPTLAAGQPLRGLADLREVRIEGEEVTQQGQTTRLAGWLPVAGNLAGLGVNEEAARVVQDDPGARIDVTVWVDGAGRIVRIMRTIVSETDVQASSTTVLTDFGAAAQIRDPLEG